MIVKRHGAVVFDNEPLKDGVTQLHERGSLGCTGVTPAESGSLSNTTTTYVVTFMIHAEFNYITHVLFNGWIW